MAVAEPKTPHTSGKDINMLVLGAHGVGKTGTVVMWMLQRFFYLFIRILETVCLKV